MAPDKCITDGIFAVYRAQVYCIAWVYAKFDQDTETFAMNFCDVEQRRNPKWVTEKYSPLGENSRQFTGPEWVPSSTYSGSQDRRS